jgi:uncharacterized protein (TIGR04255 family)
MPAASSAAGLPRFQRPPVTEALIGMQFAPLTSVRNAHIGLLWAQIRDEYPVVSEQPPIPAGFETFGGNGTPFGGQPFFMSGSMMLGGISRYWFETRAEGEHLLQFQQDRIVHNWRRRDENRAYPSYDVVKTKFVSDINKIISFLNSENLGEIIPTQCEVSYINTITESDVPEIHGRLERILSVWSGLSAGTAETTFENAGLQMRFLMRPFGESIGRVYANVAPQFLLPDLQAGYQVEVTARGKPQEATIDSALEFLDLAHEAAVRTFSDITTEKMHTVWERVDG